MRRWFRERLAARHDHAPTYPDPAHISRRPLVVCAGDSITRGVVGVCYVDILAERFPAMQFMNAGINADLSETLLRRVGDIIAVQPDVVTIMIGTNDVNAQLSQENKHIYVSRGKLTGVASLERYRANLTALVRQIRAATPARIALLSPPFIGEDLTHPANAAVAAHAQAACEVAHAEGVMYLPIHETFCGLLAALPNHQPRVRPEGFAKVMVRAIQRYYLLSRSWDALAHEQGMRYTFDCLHITRAGADVIADAIGGFLTSKP
jgi:lysophospholipase L1-like esterase